MNMFCDVHILSWRGGIENLAENSFGVIFCLSGKGEVRRLVQG